MKTLILYATKYGATEKIAKRISEKMNAAVTCNLKTDKAPGLDGFDCVIIGSSVYVGAVQKEVKDYISENAEALCVKKLGLFISGLQNAAEDECLKTNFPEEILKAAKSAKFLGGIFDPKKAGLLERAAIRVITKQSGFIDKIDEEKITAFANEMLLM